MGRKKNPNTPKWKREYNARNPPITMTGTPERKRLLDTIRGPRSYGLAFEEFINGKLDPAIEMQKKLDAANAMISAKDYCIYTLENAIKLYKISFPCEACQKSKILTANDPILEDIEKMLKKDYWWIHSECKKPGD